MTRYQIDVLSVGDDKVAFIKSIRIAGGLSLVRAKDFYIYANMHSKATIAAGLEEADARRLADDLNSAGIDTRVSQSTVLAPMLFDKNADKVFEWGSLRSLREKK